MPTYATPENEMYLFQHQFYVLTLAIYTTKWQAIKYDSKI